ncbi:portal protein [Paraburkholderia sacchari]|uniref:portal protein n=1 Tax=Paraburkholderia sacchari TaxID=159450 RepID=UPI003D967747
MAERKKDIVKRAHDRFAACVSWESDARSRFKDDIRFLFADPDNQDQWNAAVRAQRQLAGQPMVTINKTHTHWLHVVNDGKENKPSIQISATGDEATYESAQTFEQIVRRIEYISDAQSAYSKAMEFQVGGGIGYWRIVTDYTDEDSFDQEIFIKPIPDPLAVYLDPHIKRRDGSDARFGFIFDDMPTEVAERKYGKISGKSTMGEGELSWVRKDSTRVAEYYERNEAKEWLYAIEGDDGGTTLVRESDMPGEAHVLLDQAMEEGKAQRRRVPKWAVEWYLIVGDEIKEQSTWAGKYIPIIRAVGEEVVIEGRLDRKGLTRYLKDAQRAYNYNASAALEFGALQSKSPYMAPVEAIEGLENYWSTANTQNHAYLPYNHADEQGAPIPTPQRQNPPATAPVFMDGMQAAEHELMMASGQYEATFSEQGNEVSGVSIEQRQKQGQRVTFHFQDAMADAIRFTGVQLIDLIPKIYDTKRVLRIRAEDGEEHSIQIDPDAKKSLDQQTNEGQAQSMAIFNPAVGKYDVIAKCGPNFDTRREKAFDAMTQLLAAQPALAQVIGDLYMGTADFPAADKLQERMRNWIPKAILGEGPSQDEQQMQMQLQQAGQIINHLQQQLADKSIQQQLESKRVDMDALNHLALRMENDNKSILDAFKAETDRLKSLVPAMGEGALEPIIRKALSEILRAPNPDAGITPDTADPANLYAAGIQNVLAPPEPATTGAQQ